jgi:hypothetical protein
MIAKKAGASILFYLFSIIKILANIVAIPFTHIIVKDIKSWLANTDINEPAINVVPKLRNNSA